MSVQNVVSVALAMGANEGDEELLVSLGQMAMDDLMRRLRVGVTVEDCMPALEIAAAWLTLDHLEAAGGAVSTFSAGDVSFQMESGGLGLRQRAERLMAPYVEEKGFAFVGVRG